MASVDADGTPRFWSGLLSAPTDRGASDTPLLRRLRERLWPRPDGLERDCRWVKREVKRRGPQPTWEKEGVGEDRRQICTRRGRFVRFHLRGLSLVFISWELIMAACILNSDDTHFRYMSLPSFSRFLDILPKKIIFRHPQFAAQSNHKTHTIRRHIFFVYTKHESCVWLFSISRSKAALVGDFFSRALWDLERSRAILRKGTPPVRCHLHTPQRRSTSLSFSRFDKITHRSLIIFSLPWL